MPAEPAKTRDRSTLVRYADLLALVIAGPTFIVLGVDLAGYGIAAGAWIAQRLLRTYLAHRVARTIQPRTIAALTAVGLVGPVWIVALAVLLGGIAVGDGAGLSAAVLATALFTIDLPLRMKTGR